MSESKIQWEKAVEFHGHICPGLAIGFRAAELALKELGGRRSEDEELIAIVENRSCGVDAVQSLTGCSFGKGNLFFNDFGKQVYTFARRKDDRAVRVAVKYGAFYDPDFSELRVKAAKGGTDLVAKYREALNKRIEKILAAGPEAFSLKAVNITLPAVASIYRTVRCDECGEGVMEPRARLKSGRVVCIPCCGIGES